MKKSFTALLVAQFLSAFADNAILFTVIALVMHAPNSPSWYIPALQSAFLIFFVILAPWVGHFADSYPKKRVLIVANLVKASGVGLLLLNVEPLIAYAIVGAGAAIYSPAKYGILPELVDHDYLVKANSWIEGSTIVAILFGMSIGAKVADASIYGALIGTICLFLLSASIASLLPKKMPIVNAQNEEQKQSKLLYFYTQIQQFFISPRARFIVLSGALFWASAATLRVVLVAWSPLVLSLHSATEIAELTLFLAVGIVIGSAIVPRFITLEQLRRIRFAAYGMATFIMVLSFTETLWAARAVLLLIGVMGGIFIVPINAALQDLGCQSIGSGRAIAVQGFFQNLAMLIAVGSYSYAASQQISPTTTMLILGVLLLSAAFLVTFQLNRHSNITNSN